MLVEPDRIESSVNTPVNRNYPAYPYPWRDIHGNPGEDWKFYAISFTKTEKEEVL